jgi:hypothetical protein
VAEPIASYEAFWLHYLRAHRDPRTRRVHVLGTALGLALAVLALLRLDWRLLVAAVLVGYAFAWFGHFVFERNRPATFGHPLWSFYSDFRMLFLWATGRLAPELDRAGIAREERGWQR